MFYAYQTVTELKPAYKVHAIPYRAINHRIVIYRYTQNVSLHLYHIVIAQHPDTVYQVYHTLQHIRNYMLLDVSYTTKHSKLYTYMFVMMYVHTYRSLISKCCRDYVCGTELHWEKFWPLTFTVIISSLYRDSIQATVLLDTVNDEKLTGLRFGDVSQ